MSRFVSPPRFGPNSLSQGGGGGGGIAPVLTPGSVASPQRVFTATVTTGRGGMPRISIPLQPTNVVAPLYQQQQARALASGDPWNALVLAASVDGLTEDDVALLEWTTVLKLLKYYAIVDAAPAGGDAEAAAPAIARARCELVWRKKHDRVVFAAQERQEKDLARKRIQQQQQSRSGRLNVGSTSFDDMQRAAEEFRDLVKRLYPPPPIMQAAGGPVLLVRTAPQGEIHISASNHSPRSNSLSPNGTVTGDAGASSPLPVHLRKTAGSAVQERLNESRPFGVRHVNDVVSSQESSPPRSATRNRTVSGNPNPRAATAPRR
jgi:hypothetical protein